jgi:hypothetical protein
MYWSALSCLRSPPCLCFSIALILLCSQVWREEGGRRERGGRRKGGRREEGGRRERGGSRKGGRREEGGRRERGGRRLGGRRERMRVPRRREGLGVI